MKKGLGFIKNGKWLGKYRRKTTRLREWDYSWDGYYFVTICTDNHQDFFGEIVGDKMELSGIGRIIKKYWQEIPKHFNNVKLDVFIVMPGHLHGIIVIDNTMVATRHGIPITSIEDFMDNGSDVAMQRRYDRKNNYYSRISPKPNSLPIIVRSFKSICTREINKLNQKINFKWQPRYYDSVIQDESGLEIVREYIRNNVLIHELRKINNNEEFKTTIKKSQAKRAAQKPHFLQNRRAG